GKLVHITSLSFEPQRGVLKRAPLGLESNIAESADALPRGDAPGYCRLGLWPTRERCRLHNPGERVGVSGSRPSNARGPIQCYSAAPRSAMLIAPRQLRSACNSIRSGTLGMRGSVMSQIWPTLLPQPNPRGAALESIHWTVLLGGVLVTIFVFMFLMA